MMKPFSLLACLLLVGCEEPVASSTEQSPLTPSAPKPTIVKSEKWNEMTIIRSEFKGVYPFTVDEGVLRCEFNKGVPLVYFGAEGSMYALNGSAKTASPKLPKVDKIWADNPSVSGTKLNIGDVIDAGLALCDK